MFLIDKLLLKLFRILRLDGLLSDKIYLKMDYRVITGSKLNLKNPQTFNEKLQWLKLYNRKDVYTKMVDKYEAKEYVGNIIGEEYIIPTIGIYNKFEDIDFDKLPNQFVMKCTHDSGGLVIVKDKSKLDIKSAKKKINKSLKTNYYKIGREWPYKNVKPRIIIEDYMKDLDNNELNDYKFFCFNGMPRIVLTCSNRSIDLEETWFDENFNLLDLTEGGHKINKNIKKPINYDKMLEVSKILSKNIPFLRVDFYEINKKMYVGELTFYPASGFEKFNPESWNKTMGSYLELPEKKEK